MWIFLLSQLAFAESTPCAPTSAALAAEDPRLIADPLIVIDKKGRWLGRYRKGTLDRAGDAPACWRIGLGFTPAGHKQIEGDGKTPEGWYRTSDKPTSQFYAAISIHYPNKSDATAARADQRIDAATEQRIHHALKSDQKPPQTTAVGGEILIHGGGSQTDWTLGCIALDNAHIDALRTGLPPQMRTDVLIRP